MMTLEDIREAAGLPRECEPTVKEPRVIVAPAARSVDTRCPRCKEVNILEGEHVPCPEYKRSVVTGTRTCWCGGEDEDCEACKGRGWVLKFESRTFGYACSACVTEMRRKGVGNGKLLAAPAERTPLVAQRWTPSVIQRDATPRKVTVDPVEPLVLKGVVTWDMHREQGVAARG